MQAIQRPTLKDFLLTVARKNIGYFPFNLNKMKGAAVVGIQWIIPLTHNPLQLPSNRLPGEVPLEEDLVFGRSIRRKLACGGRLRENEWCYLQSRARVQSAPTIVSPLSRTGAAGCLQVSRSTSKKKKEASWELTGEKWNSPSAACSRGINTAQFNILCVGISFCHENVFHAVRL